MKRKKERQKRINSHAEITRTIKAARKKIMPPEHIKLGDDELEFFNSIIEEFAKVEWSRHKIDLAVQLARMMGVIKKAQDNLDSEGFTVKGSGSQLVMNPNITTIAKLSSVVMAMRRSLSLHAEGRSHALGERISKTKKIERRASTEDDEDGLLGAPEDDLEDLA